jgi:hypothetical protein
MKPDDVPALREFFRSRDLHMTDQVAKEFIRRIKRQVGRKIDASIIIEAAVSDEGVMLELGDIAKRLMLRASTTQHSATTEAPPKFTEFLLTALATTHAAEAMIGDLNERFADECEKFARPRAVRLYWARTLRSLWPLLRRAIGNAVKWGAVIAAVRRLF